MSTFRFQTADLSGLMTDPCRPGVEIPSGSYARDVALVGALGDVNRLTPADLGALGVVKIIPGVFDPAIETIVVRDWQRDAGGAIVVVDQTVTEVLTTQPIDPAILAERAAGQLATAKATAQVAIDAEAGHTRLRFITDITGQDATYKTKEAEAAAWAAEVAGGNLSPNLASYPYLKGRAERLNPSAPDYQAVADEWLAKMAFWHSANVAIEGVREGGKEAVAAAIDIDAVHLAQSEASAGFAAIVAAALLP